MDAKQVVDGPWTLSVDPYQPNKYWVAAKIKSGEETVAEVAATNLSQQGRAALELMACAPAMRAALQAVFDEMGKHSRWHVSTLRLEVIRPLLERCDAEASAAGLAKLAVAYGSR